jgi:hypothetical protein
MQRCPKCGYREGTDWPWILCVVAVSVLYIAFVLAADQQLKSVRLTGVLAYVLVAAAATWRGLREKRNRKLYSELHPSPTERLKGHIKASPTDGR